MLIRFKVFLVSNFKVWINWLKLNVIGNEEDYIILSLVRSQKIGFMKEKRRVNVMLTRCKKGMIILTNRVFIEGQAARSLVGGLAKAFGPGTWLESGAVLHRDFSPFS